MDLARADTTSIPTVGTATLSWGTDFIGVPKLGFALALGGQPFGAGDHVGFSPPVDHHSIRAFNSVVRQKGLDDPAAARVTDAQ